jgi:WD40 repeat protein
LAFSQTARTLAVCGGKEIALYELTLEHPADKDLDRIRRLLEKLDDNSYDEREAADKELLQVGFLADGELRRAAKDGKSGGVRMRAGRLREEMLSRPRAIWRGHSDDIQALPFSHHGKLLASGGKDGTERFWDTSAQKGTARLLLAN